MPRLSSEIATHLEKARDSALLAVETYNRPRISFRSGGYIVMMCIAWTALLHALFFNRNQKPFYRKKTNPRHFEMLDGDKKAWELSHCLGEFWGANNPPVRLNLEFFVRLRNKIEHRSMPGLDIDIFGECQALLFNFEDLITREFGDKWALNESLSLALQFSCHRNEQQQTSIRKLHRGLAKDITTYVNSFRTSLSAEQLQDMQFSYKVFLFPKPANHASAADLAVEFIKYNPNNPEEMDRIGRAIALIKPTTPPAIPATGLMIGDLGGIPVRLVTDLNATVVRAIDHDTTHPFRQKDLVHRINELLSPEAKVSTYDLTAIKYAFEVVSRLDYYHQPKFGSAQYSEAYAQWVAQSIGADPDFLIDARAKYRDQR